MAVDYATLLDAVASYYGQGSDVYNSVLTQYVGGYAPASDFASVMKQVPGVRSVVNSAGEVLYYEYDASVMTSTAGSIASNINSNAAASAATKLKVPATITSETGAGGETLISGASSGAGGAAASGLSFVANSVMPAVAATAVGLQLGKTFDSALYNVNPDFWDSRGMSSLNPETWASITEGDSGIGSSLFNMLFGIDSNGKAQPYIDENALAYMSAYMAQMGVFDSGDEYNLDDDTPLVKPFNLPVPIVTSWRQYNNNGYSNLISGCYIVPTQSTSSNSAYVFVVSDSSGPFPAVHYKPDGSIWYQDTFTLTRSYTRNGLTVYFSNYSTGGYPPTIMFPYTFASGTNDGEKAWDILYTALHGHASGGIQGIGDQSGADIWDPSGIADLSNMADVLASLKSKYPGLWDDAVTINGVTDDGTITEHVYVPVAMPDINLQNSQQTTGQNQSQQNPQFDPDALPDLASAIAALISGQVSEQTDPDGETKYPIDEITPAPPDTGGGDTPPVILPTGSASALFAVYNPTQAQVDSFGAWLWSSNFVDQLKKIFNDPMESIISLHKVFASPSTGGSQDIYVGYLDSGVSSTVVTSQYATVDCGSVTLSEYFGNVFDYNNTSIELFLPFIGIVPLSISDAMRGSINVTYHVDVLTGACLAEISITRDSAGGVLYQYSGDCAVHYPVSSGSYIGIVGGILAAGAGIAGTVATGGAMAPMLLGSGAALMRTHTDVARSGGFSANSGAMGCKKPYLIISRPQTAMPSNYQRLEGEGSNITATLGSCSGYTRVKTVQLSGLSQAYDGEVIEIENLLTSGVII